MSTAKSNHTTTTRRRTLFGAAAAVTATTIAAPVVANHSPDGELIACCERLIAIEGEMNAICTAAAAARRDPDLDALHNENDDLMQRIEKLPDASTQEGLRKMSQAALATSAQGQSGICDGEGEWLAFKVASILSGEGRPVRIDRSPANVDPDADLLELCARFHKQAAAAEATEDWDDDGLTAAIDVRHDIADQIEEISAVTDAGMRAKAQVAVFWLEESRGPDFSNSFSRGSCELWFALEALRDIAGSVVA